MSKTTTTYQGMGFASWLTLLFIGLKLTKVISWSWWLVLSPLLIVWALVIFVLIILLIAACIMGIAKWIDR
jgi:hypothetical protein